MVKFSIEQLHGLMKKQRNVRNMCVIAHVDHGKSTLTDTLVRKAGLSTKNCYTHMRKDEELRGITIKSAAVSMAFELPAGARDPPAGADGRAFLINLCDTPGHADFNSEVTAALRLADGALVVVDVVEGSSVQTETVLRQALGERVRPVLMVNKCDRLLLQLRFSGEEVYQRLQRVIEGVNASIATYRDTETMPDYQVAWEDGTVAFGAARDGWAVSLPQMAALYARVLGVPEATLRRRLWGDNYYDAAKKKFTTSPTADDGTPLKRAFVEFVWEPIAALIADATEMRHDALDRKLQRLGADALSSAERALPKAGALVDAVMRRAFCAADTLLDMMVHHLPDPVDAQRYRTAQLYTGAADDAAADAMRRCDPNGPLVVFVSKLVPAGSRRFYAFGRVFSGTVRAGQRLRILGPNYVHRGTGGLAVGGGGDDDGGDGGGGDDGSGGSGGSTATTTASATSGAPSADLYVDKSVQRVVALVGREVMTVDDCPAGNLIALGGLDAFILKTATLTDAAATAPVQQLKFTVSPVVQRAVAPADPADMPKLIEALRLLLRVDPLVRVITNETTKEQLVAGAGDLHLEICLGDLAELAGGIRLVISDPVVPLRESVSAASTQTCLAKSANMLNRLWAAAEPVGDALVAAIEARSFRPPTTLAAATSASEAARLRARRLVDEFGWDGDQARRLWAFGPEASPLNALVDASHGVAHLSEARDAVVAGFHWAAGRGVLADEEVRGVRYRLLDAQLHADSAHRGSGQLMPAARRVFYGAQLCASPVLLEPVYAVTIAALDQDRGAIHSLMARLRGMVLSEEPGVGALYTVRASLPVLESMRFSEDLRSATSGRAFAQTSFDHWAVLEGNPLDPADRVYKRVSDIRKRKGLSERPDTLEQLCDKM